MNTTKQIDRPSFWSAFLDGLLPSWEVARHSVERKSDLERMRGDWQRVGGDFRVAIEKARTDAGPAHR